MRSAEERKKKVGHLEPREPFNADRGDERSEGDELTPAGGGGGVDDGCSLCSGDSDIKLTKEEAENTHRRWTNDPPHFDSTLSRSVTKNSKIQQ